MPDVQWIQRVCESKYEVNTHCAANFTVHHLIIRRIGVGEGIVVDAVHDLNGEVIIELIISGQLL